MILLTFQLTYQCNLYYFHLFLRIFLNNKKLIFKNIYIYFFLFTLRKKDFAQKEEFCVDKNYWLLVKHKLKCGVLYIENVVCVLSFHYKTDLIYFYYFHRCLLSTPKFLLVLKMFQCCCILILIFL